MKTNKHMGIWMDHSTAHLMDANTSPIVTKTITSGFTHSEKERKLGKSEYSMHKDEQHKQHAYYKTLGEEIKNYNKVILFGPTQAKEELWNMLKDDHAFKQVRIFVKHADKMTENQQHAFVRDYFNNA